MLSARSRERQTKDEEPLEVQLTVAFRFGEDPGDRVVMIDNRSIPMVDTVFESRDTIVRNFAKLLVRAGLTQPKVLQELLPALKLLKRRPRKS